MILVAAKLAALFGVTLICAHVDTSRFPIRELPDGTFESEPIDPDLADDPDDFDPQLRDHILALVPADLSVDFRQLAGDTSIALREEAEILNAEVIVVGSRAGGLRANIQDFLGTSVAVHLAHRQWRPVVVVPTSPTAPDRPLPWERAASQA
ncbi:universal stress protein [Microlunatus elymi]|uniref:universal stress protein n=1 Tax=Microlunatus elymi TaxID=2596828 RepID=UPI00143CE7C8|nr:universal stress protein [Microlunatus elymi]